MNFRYLGKSGFKISEITYGNWLTHGSQLENDQATACVRAALECGISTFDTADVYANTKAETVLGEALKGERRESLKPLAEEAGLSMAALAVAWTLQNDNVATAIIGASKPEQVRDNATAAGVKLDADLLAKVDEILDPVVERNPAKTQESSPKTREA